MRIALHWPGIDLGAMQVLIRCADTLAQRGIDVKSRPDQPPRRGTADVYVLHQACATREVLDDLDGPAVLMERVDSAQVMSRQAIRHDAVRLALKPAVLGGHLNDGPLPRHHLQFLDPSVTGKTDPLSDDVIAKIKPGPGFAQYDRRQRQVEAEVELDAPRTWEVSFAGTTSSYAVPEISRHRQSLICHLGRIAEHRRVFCVPSKSLSRVQFDELTLDTQVVVSPWGHGELCHRDIEAMLLGAVLIKPNSDHVLTDPVTFIDGVTYVACRPDWSDLERKIDHVLDNWAIYRQMRADNMWTMRNAFGPGFAADMIEGFLMDVA